MLKGEGFLRADSKRPRLRPRDLSSASILQSLVVLILTMLKHSSHCSVQSSCERASLVVTDSRDESEIVHETEFGNVGLDPCNFILLSCRSLGNDLHRAQK